MPRLAEVPHGGAQRDPRPETYLLVLFGDQVLGRGVAVATGSVIAVLSRLGVGEHATRTAIARMVRRGLLRSLRQGRQAFLGLTPHAVEVLNDGLHKLEADVVDRNWDGQWTLLSFSVPETRRADRHALRTRLNWHGFAPLRSGLWISTWATDVSRTLSELDLLDRAQVFRARASQWTDPAAIVREAWDLTVIAEAHLRFLGNWAEQCTGLDELSLRIRLSSAWLLTIRHDPRLPWALLPPDWPGVRAQELYRATLDRLVEPADALAAGTLHTLPDEQTALAPAD